MQIIHLVCVWNELCIKYVLEKLKKLEIYPDYNKILDYFDRYIDDCRYKKDFNNEERKG